MSSTPACSNQPVLNHEASAVSLQRIYNPVMLCNRPQERKADGKKYNVTSKSNQDVEYAAKTNKEHLEMLHIRYIQAAYLARIQGAEFDSSQEEKMKELLCTLMEVNNNLAKELLDVTTQVNNLEHRLTFDKHLKTQMEALKDADVICSAVSDTTYLAKALDCKRHVLKTNNLAPPTEDLEKILNDIGACASAFGKELATNMESFNESSKISSALTEEAVIINNCDQLSGRVERLAVDQIGIDIGKIL